MWADLFEALDEVAAEYGWQHIGQPHDYLRRYGKGEGGLSVTLTALANTSGTGITRVTRRTITTDGERTNRVLGHRDGGKRAQFERWLRWAYEDRRTD